MRTNYKDLNYLGFKWTKEIYNKAIELFEDGLNSNVNFLEFNEEEFRNWFKTEMSTNGVPLSIGTEKQAIYEAVVSGSRALRWAMYENNKSVADIIGDRDLFNSCPDLAIEIQNAILDHIADFSRWRIERIYSHDTIPEMVGSFAGQMRDLIEEFEERDGNVFEPIIDTPLNYSYFDIDILLSDYMTEYTCYEKDRLISLIPDVTKHEIACEYLGDIRNDIINKFHQKMNAEHDIGGSLQDIVEEELAFCVEEALVEFKAEKPKLETNEKLTFRVIKPNKSLNERVISARSVSEAQQKNHISQVRTFDRERG